MAIRFRVFDYEDHSRLGFVWCVRCEDWIPIDQAFGLGLGHDPHVSDHMDAYHEMQFVYLSIREKEINDGN